MQSPRVVKIDTLQTPVVARHGEARRCRQGGGRESECGSAEPDMVSQRCHLMPRRFLWVKGAFVDVTNAGKLLGAPRNSVAFYARKVQIRLMFDAKLPRSRPAIHCRPIVTDSKRPATARSQSGAAFSL